MNEIHMLISRSQERSPAFRACIPSVIFLGLFLLSSCKQAGSSGPEESGVKPAEREGVIDYPSMPDICKDITDSLARQICLNEQHIKVLEEKLKDEGMSPQERASIQKMINQARSGVEYLKSRQGGE